VTLAEMVAQKEGLKGVCEIIYHVGDLLEFLLKYEFVGPLRALEVAVVLHAPHVAVVLDLLRRRQSRSRYRHR